MSDIFTGTPADLTHEETYLPRFTGSPANARGSRSI